MVKYIVFIFITGIALADNNSLDPIIGVKRPIQPSSELPNQINGSNVSGENAIRNPMNETARAQYNQSTQQLAKSYQGLMQDAASGRYDTSNMPELLKMLADSVNTNPKVLGHRGAQFDESAGSSDSNIGASSEDGAVSASDLSRENQALSRQNFANASGDSVKEAQSFFGDLFSSLSSSFKNFTGSSVASDSGDESGLKPMTVFPARNAVPVMNESFFESSSLSRARQNAVRNGFGRESNPKVILSELDPDVQRQLRDRVKGLISKLVASVPTSAKQKQLLELLAAIQNDPAAYDRLVDNLSVVLADSMGLFDKSALVAFSAESDSASHRNGARGGREIASLSAVSPNKPVSRFPWKVIGLFCFLAFTVYYSVFRVFEPVMIAPGDSDSESDSSSKKMVVKK